MSKKLLAPLDIRRPTKRKSGFLIPNADSCNFLEIRSGQPFDTGLVVFTGCDVNLADIEGQLIAGGQFSLIDRLRNGISQMLSQMSNFKIGDIVGIRPNFELVKLERPERPKSKLPN